jgi:uncharacterized protein YdeI (YjbR/CyaY-like superfamily)
VDGNDLMTEAIYFESATQFREWLDKNHATASEILVGYHKVSTGVPSMTWAQSVDEALCYGWIDGVRRGVDAHRYTIRFTPRKRTSIWSAGNIKHVGELMAEDRMQPSGLAAFEARREDRSRVYSFEQESIDLPPDLEQRFKENSAAWSNFHAMPPSYRKPALWWVISAKQDSTRQRRFETLIADSANGLKIKPLRRPTDKQG